MQKETTLVSSILGAITWKKARSILLANKDFFEKLGVIVTVEKGRIVLFREISSEQAMRAMFVSNRRIRTEYCKKDEKDWVPERRPLPNDLPWFLRELIFGGSLSKTAS
ncbi:MAG: hypothetical protein Q8P39_03810 [Candidatus Yanofskybacteria bacterium]|nr:hypothetical protein [Candidatus Yanofskybacteria bacterium]